MINKKEGIKRGALEFAIVLAVIIISTSFVSAGVGIKWQRESILAEQGAKVCLTYSVYNPWESASSVKISVSDELKSLLESQESETRNVPANTASKDAIPLQFCFRVPVVYQEGRECLIGDYMCKQECSGQMKVYSGEIVVSEEAAQAVSGGTGGSSALASVSAPLDLKVICNAHERSYKSVYIMAALIAAIVIIVLMLRKRKK